MQELGSRASDDLVATGSQDTQHLSEGIHLALRNLDCLGQLTQSGQRQRTYSRLEFSTNTFKVFGNFFRGLGGFFIFLQLGKLFFVDPVQFIGHILITHLRTVNTALVIVWCTSRSHLVHREVELGDGQMTGFHTQSTHLDLTTQLLHLLLDDFHNIDIHVQGLFVNLEDTDQIGDRLGTQVIQIGIGQEGLVHLADSSQRVTLPGFPNSLVGLSATLYHLIQSDVHAVEHLQGLGYAIFHGSQDLHHHAVACTDGQVRDTRHTRVGRTRDERFHTGLSIKV